MAPPTENSPAALLPVRCETISPDTNWSSTWCLLRSCGLSSNISSFLFKLVHLLLPTQDRVKRLGADRDNAAGCCLLCGAEDDILHDFFSCPHTCTAGLAILGWAQTIVPNLSQKSALRLEVKDVNIDAHEQLAFAYILGTGFNLIWQARLKKNRVYHYDH